MSNTTEKCDEDILWLHNKALHDNRDISEAIEEQFTQKVAELWKDNSLYEPDTDARNAAYKECYK